jgi:hypothetical protein
VTRKLQSADRETVAWGAFEAGAFHVTEAVPALQSILDAPLPRQDDWAGWALVDLALDSLIQLRAPLPAALVARYAGARPVQAYILLTRSNDRVPVLVDLLADASGSQWYAAANMLLDDKAPGLAAHLLRTVRLRLTITVSEGGNRMRGAGGGSGTWGVGDGVGQSPPAFPPHAAYRFEFSPRPGLSVLAHGPRPLFYSRTVHTTLQYPVSALHIGGPGDDDRLAYLHTLLDPWPTTQLRADTEEVATWTTPEALLVRVAELRGDLERRFRSMRMRIEQIFEVPADSPPVPIEVQLVDARKDRSVPLPPIPH